MLRSPLSRLSYPVSGATTSDNANEDEPGMGAGDELFALLQSAAVETSAKAPNSAGTNSQRKQTGGTNSKHGSPKQGSPVGSPTQQLASLPQGRAPKNRNHQNQRGTPCQIHAMDQRTRQKGTANQLGVIQEIQGRKTTTKARTTMVARITMVARKRARKKMRREGFYSTRKRVSSTRMTNGGCITISQEAHRI